MLSIRYVPIIIKILPPSGVKELFDGRIRNLCLATIPLSYSRGLVFIESGYELGEVIEHSTTYTLFNCRHIDRMNPSTGSQNVMDITPQMVKSSPRIP